MTKPKTKPVGPKPEPTVAAPKWSEIVAGAAKLAKEPFFADLTTLIRGISALREAVDTSGSVDDLKAAITGAILPAQQNLLSLLVLRFDDIEGKLADIEEDLDEALGDEDDDGEEGEEGDGEEGGEEGEDEDEDGGAFVPQADVIVITKALFDAVSFVDSMKAQYGAIIPAENMAQLEAVAAGLAAANTAMAKAVADSMED